MSRKIVGLTCSSEISESGPRNFVNKAYCQAIAAAGGIPIVLPITKDPASVLGALPLLDGLLLTGGVDVAPNRYGQEAHPQLGEIDEDRDAAELALIPAALERELPILAICRGIQTLNVALGGTLYQDLPSEAPSTVQHLQKTLGIPRDQTSHTIRIDPASRLSCLLGSVEIPVNSFHHQAIRKLGAGLAAVAWAEDEIIEAVELPGKRFVLGVQFHPEETFANEYSRRIFEGFIAALSDNEVSC